MEGVRIKREACRVWAVIVVVLSSGSLLSGLVVRASPDYCKALELSLYFFDAQRSGYLPQDQRVTWRGNSGVNDGQDQNMDLTGGYYDAGDNVKFQLPMAFSVTTLAWSVIEYRKQLDDQGQAAHALDAIRWGTDYFIKTHPSPNVLWAEVGDGDTDHECWQRPEDMSTSRRSYKIDENNPGSEVAGETAAAMAAASIVFKDTDPDYSSTLLQHAKELFNFGDQYRGKYDASIPIVQRYYPSVSGYGDELLWAAFWLFEATGDQMFLEYAINNAQELGGTGWAMNQFGWDVKYSGLQVLASKILLQGRGEDHVDTLKAYQVQASFFLCSCLNKNAGQNLQRSPGGLFWIQPWNNMQFVSSASFLLSVYADYLTLANEQLFCPDAIVDKSELLATAQGQIDYILGKNPRGTSYIVGFTENYPREVHHRGSSIVSIHVDASPVECRNGYAEWYKKPEENPNLLLGALVGGPDLNDDFIDERDNFQMTEACLYNNGPLVGVLARLAVDSMGQSLNREKVEGFQEPPLKLSTSFGPSGQSHQSSQETELKFPPAEHVESVGSMEQSNKFNLGMVFPTPLADGDLDPPPPITTDQSHILLKNVRHQLPRKINVLVQEWQRTTALMEEKMLDRRWEGVWIQVLGFAWLLYRCLFRLIVAWFMYGGLKSEALLMFSKSLGRKIGWTSFFNNL